jgi:5'(3')-deoxyribonucleotidase
MKTIAVDVDEVLSASAQGFVAFSNERWGTNLTVDDYHEHWAQMWGVSEEEADTRQEILNNEGIIQSYQPFANAYDVLKKLSKNYRLLVATSRTSFLSEETVIWIDKHFQGIFENIHHSGIYDVTDEDRHKATKAQLCIDIGADYLIDDQLKHCVGVAEVGIQSILFGDYAWNRTNDKLPESVTRCKDWTEILEYFDEHSR